MWSRRSTGDHLIIVPDVTVPDPRVPSFVTLIARGATRRCPWCGDHKAFFIGWFSKQDACRGCGTPWRRGDVGFELAALTINMILTFGLVLIGIASLIVATLPDVPVLTVVIVLCAMALVLPALLYPLSFTIWQALDLKFRPPATGELDAPER